ncbi:hypothetical protein PC110_g12186 [Phytophthora cactorum]|uniref:Uncharacterized protein n=1 Tax=Phytophthora cactorum TaxID=29920 RepID=A0A329S4P9_9STRA|nr:hypothetical protein PC110_g12186 [Phytophthora cactorum]
MPTNAQLQAEIDRLNQVMADRTRVPTNLPKSTGKRGEDVREWMSQVENACRINYIPIEDASTRIPGIAGSAMEKPASAGSCTGRRRLEARSTVGEPGTLINAMDIVVKYEVTHFVDDARKRQYREDKKRSPANQKSGQGKPSKEKISFRGRGRFKLKSDTKHTESRTCHFCKKPAHIKAN